MEVDVVVVGGGLSGLQAASLIVQNGLSVLVIEQADHLGGRSYSKEMNGFTLDLGAQWVGPMQNEIMDLIRNNNIDTYSQYDQGNVLLDMDGTVVSYNCSLSKLNNFGESKLMELSSTVKIIDSLAGQLRQQLSDLNQEILKLENVQKWMKTSIADWLLSNMNSEIAIRVLSIAIESVMGIDCQLCSLFGFLWTVATCGGYRNLVFTKGGAQQDKIANSTKKVVDLLAGKVGRDNIRTECTVDHIKQHSEGITVRYHAKTKTEGNFIDIQAKYCIVTIPPTALTSISFDPPLPSDKLTLLSNITMGSILKMILVFKNHFWRDKNLSGELMGNGYVSFVFDGCHKECQYHALICYAVGTKAKTMSSLPLQGRKDAVVSYICHIYGSEASDLLEDYVEEMWENSGYFATLKPTHELDCMKDIGWYSRTLTEPFGRVLWGGSETSMVWPGYMNGALESARRAATQVLQLLSSK